MNINIDITAELDISIKVNQNILDDVVRHYNGDFERWARENYMDYFDSDDLKFNAEYISFNKEEANKLLDDARETLKSDEDDLTIVAINRTKLAESRIYYPMDAKGLNTFEIDLETITKVSKYCDIKNPKTELNYIHLKNNTIQATDTIRLIKYDSCLSVENEVFFPPYFIEPLKNGGKLFITKENVFILNYNNVFYEGLVKKNPTFPDTDRIISNKEDAKLEKIPFEQIKTKLVIINEFQQAVEIKIGDNIKYFRRNFWEEAVQENIEYIGWREDENYPMIYLFGSRFQIVLMPIFVDDETIIEEKENV